MLTVGVLGPLDVRRDGRPLPVPSGRTTELLVRLALEAGRVVSAERLIDDLWGDAAAATGRNTLQSKVSQLRRALGEPDRLSSGHGGYRLQLEPDQVDALRVVALAAEAGAARRDGDPVGALAAADEALALFRGEVLAEAGTATGCTRTGPGWRSCGSPCWRTGSPPGSSSAPAPTWSPSWSCSSPRTRCERACGPV